MKIEMKTIDPIADNYNNPDPIVRELIAQRENELIRERRDLQVMLHLTQIRLKEVNERLDALYAANDKRLIEVLKNNYALYMRRAKTYKLPVERRVALQEAEAIAEQIFLKTGENVGHKGGL